MENRVKVENGAGQWNGTGKQGWQRPPGNAAGKGIFSLNYHGEDDDYTQAWDMNSITKMIAHKTLIIITVEICDTLAIGACC